MITARVQAVLPQLTARVQASFQTGVDLYEGPYSVEPDWTGTTLETSGKHVPENITVKAIHTWEFSNDAGGTTCVIGPEN